MAAWDGYPNKLVVMTAYDGTMYWEAVYETTAYTIGASFLTGETLRSIIGEGVTFIRLVTANHTTNAANEQSALTPGYMKESPWPAFESTNTQDGYQFYGPIGPLERPATAAGELITLTDAYSEWTGNVTTKLHVFGKTMPLRYQSVTQTPYIQDVNVKKAEIWPWG